MSKDDALFFDIESGNADQMWDRDPRKFFKLGQYAWGREGEIVLTEDYDEMIAMIRKARVVIGHNIHAFDLTALFGKDSTEPLQMALERKVLDTFTWASQAFPSPTVWTDKNGHTFYNGDKPGMAMKWLGLDNLTHQFDLPGKVGSLQEIAKRYNPPKTKVGDLDYGLIDVNDEEYRLYAYNDIVALRALSMKLLELPGGVTEYIWREQLFAAICAQTSRNGWKVDVDKAQQRVDFLTDRKERILAEVVEKYGLPTTGTQPWRSNDGKAAIFAALMDYGISPDTVPEWPRTKPGKMHPTGTPSLGGEVMLQVTEGTPAEDLGQALAELMGQRSLAALALDSMKSDGKVHPDITYLQRSGRTSTTRPGLTVWTARGPGAIEKEYFITDSPATKLVSFDYSNADARVVAAYSGDTEYIKRFDPDVDAHELTSRLVWGDEVYEESMLPGWEDDDEIRKKNPLRHTAKMLTHAYSYGARPKTLMLNSAGKGYPTPDGKPLDLETTTRFCEVMDEAYADVIQWQRNASQQGNTGWITNDWGRRMPVDKARAFTQSSALLGQSGTREIMVDGLIKLARLDIRYITMLRALVHDEIIMEIPAEGVDKTIPIVVKSMSKTWKPQVGGQAVDFTLSYGKPADNWYEAGH